MRVSMVNTGGQHCAFTVLRFEPMRPRVWLRSNFDLASIQDGAGAVFYFVGALVSVQFEWNAQ